jgi:hypothetical protein
MTTSSRPGSFPVGIGLPSEGEPCDDLVVVTISTRSGALYHFPDMSLQVLKRVLPETGRTPDNQPTLMLMNISAALISVPFNIIQDVSHPGGLLWSRSASK